MIKIWPGWNKLRWDWLQVEVSSQCHASCVYCPTAIYSKDASRQLMTMDTFLKLSPALERTNLVYLQGWGEPLLNPCFFEMVRTAKSVGCRVGMTTNGMLLKDARLIELVSTGIDLITFSIAGCTHTNDVIRQGTRLAQVIHTIKRLQQLKVQNVSIGPQVHIAYMLLRSGLDEIELLPELLAGLDISQVVISTLDFVPIPELSQEALVPSTRQEFDGLQTRLDRLAAAAQKSDLEIHYQFVTLPEPSNTNLAEFPARLDWAAILPAARPACTENVQRAAFVSAGGDVSPCVFTHLPVESPEVAEAYSGKPYLPLSFGNICDQPLEMIWNSKAFRAFRRSHRIAGLVGPCRECKKPRVLVV